MSLTILYRHRDRPEEAAMTMISGHGQVAATTLDQLEKRGFVVDKITARSVPNTIGAPSAVVAPEICYSVGTDHPANVWPRAMECRGVSVSGIAIGSAEGVHPRPRPTYLAIVERRSE